VESEKTLLFGREETMDEIIAFCGLTCTGCPVYLATQKDDDRERERVAERWTKLFNTKFEPQDVNCDGCVAEGGRLFSFCGVCEIRKCGQARGVQNCAFCDDYACQKLEDWFARVSEAKQTLDRIREST